MRVAATRCRSCRYEAHLADLSYSLLGTRYGLELAFSGFSDKMMTLVMVCAACAGGFPLFHVAA